MMSSEKLRFSSSWLLLVGGVVAVGLLELSLFANVRGWTAHTPWEALTRWTRADMTPLAWLFYIVALLGLLSRLEPGDRTWPRRYKWRLTMLWLWSVTCWCYFDWMNFYFMRDPATGIPAWQYIGLPPYFAERVAGYLVAFGSIAPGMFLSAEVINRLGFRRLLTRPMPLPTWILITLAACGVVLCLVPVVIGGPISALALWLGTFALLDPLNYVCNRPSILGDWHAGRWGRTLALGAGGLWCGLLWEFWNYWALAKWQYHLPFLGAAQNVKYFEMPLPGLLGFVAFGIQVWVMWQTTLLILQPVVEGRGDAAEDRRLRTHGCF